MSQFLLDLEGGEEDFFQDEEEKLDEVGKQYLKDSNSSGDAKKSIVIDNNSNASNISFSFVNKRKKENRKRRKKKSGNNGNSNVKKKGVKILISPPVIKDFGFPEKEDEKEKRITYVNHQSKVKVMDKLYFSRMEEIDVLNKEKICFFYTRSKLIAFGGVKEDKTITNDMYVYDLINETKVQNLKNFFVRYNFRYPKNFFGMKVFDLSGRGDFLAFFDGSLSKLWILKNLHESQEETRKLTLRWKTIDFDYFDIKSRSTQPVEDFCMHYYQSKLFVFGGKIAGTRQKTNRMFAMVAVSEYNNYFRQKKTDFSDMVFDGNVPNKFIIKEIVPEKNHSKRFPSKRSHSCCCENRNNLFIYGGIDESGNVLNDLWLFDFENYEFKQISVFVKPPGLYNSSLFTNKTDLFLFGGYSDKNNLVPVKEMYRYKFFKNEWVGISPTNVSNYDNLASYTVFSLTPSDVLIVGGKTGTKDNIRNSETIYSIKGIVTDDKKDGTLKFLERQRKKKMYTDFRIILDKSKKEVIAHKCIISRLKFFRDSMKYCKENEGYLEIKIEDDFDKEAVELFIGFCYTGEIRIVGEQMIEEVKKISKKWGFHQEILKIIQGDIPIQNSFKIKREIQSYLQSILKKEIFSDLEIVCELDGSIIRAHKVIMTKSDFIIKCLNAGMIETKENKLIFNSLSAKGLNQVLHYLYTGEIRGINHETCVEVHIFSLIFKLPVIGGACRKLIVDLVDENSAIGLYKIFNLYKDNVICSKCIKVIANNYDSVKVSKSYADISEDFQKTIELAYRKERMKHFKKTGL